MTNFYINKKVLFNIFTVAVICSTFLMLNLVKVYAKDNINNFNNDFNNISSVSEFTERGFIAQKDQSFDVYFESFGNVKFIPAVYDASNMSCIFLSDKSGNIIYKTEDLVFNYHLFKNVEAVTFKDLNDDGMKDILIIGKCFDYDNAQNEEFKIADILYQSNMKFEKDSNVTNALNKYDMNKNISMVLSYLSGEKSKQFLYESLTLDELINNGFKIIEDQSFNVNFESFGNTRVVSGYYNMGGLNNLYIYIINNDGFIMDFFNPNLNFDKFNKIKAISFDDVNQDGLKDIILLAQYNSCGVNQNKELHCSVFFQNEKYFFENNEFKNKFNIGKDDNIITSAQKAKLLYESIIVD